MRISDWSSDVCSSDLLAQVYERGGDFAKATAAYREAIALVGKLGPVPGPLHAALGETLVAADDGRVGREARLAFAAAIKADPGNSRARYYTGLAMAQDGRLERSEEHTSELPSLMRISYAVFCLKKKKHTNEST